jgi:hypothetical protein
VSRINAGFSIKKYHTGAKYQVFVFWHPGQKLRVPTYKWDHVTDDLLTTLRSGAVLPAQPKRWKWRVIVIPQKQATVTRIVRLPRKATRTSSGFALDHLGAECFESFDAAFTVFCTYARML